MIDSFASSVIGFLIAALSVVGGHANVTVTNDTASSTATTSTEISVDDTFFIELANALVRMQDRFKHERPEPKEEKRALVDASKDSSRSLGVYGNVSSEEKHSDSQDGALVRSDSREEFESRDREDEEEREFESDDDEDEYEYGSRGGSAAHASLSVSSPSSSRSITTSSSGTSANAQTTFTLAQIAQHSTAVSCYSAVNGGVYDLTLWISKHPGGASAIKGMCGVDGSAAFNGQHGGSSKPESILLGYKIGTLAR